MHPAFLFLIPGFCLGVGVFCGAYFLFFYESPPFWCLVTKGTGPNEKHFVVASLRRYDTGEEIQFNCWLDHAGDYGMLLPGRVVLYYPWSGKVKNPFP